MEVVEKFRGSHGALSKRGKFRVTARETGALHTEVELGERLRSRHTLLPRTPRQEQDPPPTLPAQSPNSIPADGEAVCSNSEVMSGFSLCIVSND